MCVHVYIYIFCIKKFLSTIYGIYLVLLIRKYLITSNKYQQECYRPFLKSFHPFVFLYHFHTHWKHTWSLGHCWHEMLGHSQKVKAIGASGHLFSGVSM